MFITHNLSVVKHISHDIMVMYLGCQVEKCSSKELFSRSRCTPIPKACCPQSPFRAINMYNRQRIVMSGRAYLSHQPKARLPVCVPLPLCYGTVHPGAAEGGGGSAPAFLRLPSGGGRSISFNHNRKEQFSVRYHGSRYFDGYEERPPASSSTRARDTASLPLRPRGA